MCGSPAVNGYADVKPECLEASPTAQWWAAAAPRPADLQVHIEKESDYDGLAVAWGIGNTQASVEACAEQCRRHVPAGDGAQLAGCSGVGDCPTPLPSFEAPQRLAKPLLIPLLTGGALLPPLPRPVWEAALQRRHLLRLPRVL